MKDYSDRIGEPVRGISLFDKVDVIGYYVGKNNGDHVISTPHDETWHHCNEIEFLVPSVFRHYGKSAITRLWIEGKQHEYSNYIILVRDDGSCLATDDIINFERYGECESYHNYTLVEKTHTITIDGKKNELMEEQKKPKFDYEQISAIYCWFGDPCYDLASIAETEEQKDYLGMIEKISGITGATNLQQAEFFNGLFSVLTPEQKAQIMEVLG
jgi:hypothetical protein